MVTYLSCVQAPFTVRLRRAMADVTQRSHSDSVRANRRQNVYSWGSIREIQDLNTNQVCQLVSFQLVNTPPLGHMTWPLVRGFFDEATGPHRDTTTPPRRWPFNWDYSNQIFTIWERFHRNTVVHPLQMTYSCSNSFIHLLKQNLLKIKLIVNNNDKGFIWIDDQRILWTQRLKQRPYKRYKKNSAQKKLRLGKSSSNKDNNNRDSVEIRLHWNWYLVGTKFWIAL